MLRGIRWDLLAGIFIGAGYYAWRIDVWSAGAWAWMVFFAVGWAALDLFWSRWKLERRKP